MWKGKCYQILIQLVAQNKKRQSSKNSLKNTTLVLKSALNKYKFEQRIETELTVNVERLLVLSF